MAQISLYCKVIVHNGIKLGIKHITYQKLANFMQKKDIYVNRVESVIFGM